MEAVKQAVHIDTSLIPEWAEHRIASATLKFIKRIQKMPGGREAIDAKIWEMRKGR